MASFHKDVFSGDKLFSDTYPMKLVSNCIYEVCGKHEMRVEDKVQLKGSNALAEEADEGTDTNTVSRVNVILNHQLTDARFNSKRDYMVYLKKIVKYLEDNSWTNEVDTFKNNINGYMKEVLSIFKHLQFIIILDCKECIIASSRSGY